VRAGRLAALETTDTLLEKRRKRVVMVFDRPVDPGPFAQLPGVSDVAAWDNSVGLRLADGIDAVIKLAAQHTILDLRVEHPSLDEVFMSYYGQEQPWRA
jgi:ABC-2 type transport system ATP-binding protein